MANAQSSTAPSDGNIHRWLTTAASLVVGTAFFALWFWLLPQWLGFQSKSWAQRDGDGWL